MDKNFQGSATSPSGPLAGANAAGSNPDPRAVLAAMVAQREAPASLEPETSPTPAAQADPDSQEIPAETGETGQTLLAPDAETPSAPADEAAAPDDSPNDLSHPPSSELESELQKLSPTEQNHLAAMLKKLTTGEASWNDLKRVPKLKSEIETLKQEFEAKIESLKADRATEANVAPVAQAGVPETVARLKSAAEVEARLELANANAEALQDFLDANPGDAQTLYRVGDQEFTRAQLIEKRAVWRAELRALPRRLNEIAQHAQFVQARQAAEAKIRQDFPILTDADNPDTQLARQLVKDPRFASEVNAEYMALAMATGHRLLQEQLTGRKAKGNGGGVKPLGKVPLGKPGMNGAGSAPARTQATLGTSELLKRVGTERNRESLAALLEATGA